VNVVATDFDAAGTPSNTSRFMMYIAWHEGARLKYRFQQLGGGATGPALSFFQIQGASAQTAYNSRSITEDRLNTLVGNTGVSHDAIVARLEALSASASFREPAAAVGHGTYVALLWTFPVTSAATRHPASGSLPASGGLLV
jgi:hypothetical protein